MPKSNATPPRQDVSLLQALPSPMTFSQSDGLLLPIYTSCINFIFSKIQLFFYLQVLQLLICIFLILKQFMLQCLVLFLSVENILRESIHAHVKYINHKQCEILWIDSFVLGSGTSTVLQHYISM